MDRAAGARTSHCGEVYPEGGRARPCARPLGLAQPEELEGVSAPEHQAQRAMGAEGEEAQHAGQILWSGAGQTDEADGEVAQGGQDLGSEALAHAAAILVEGDVADPVQAVFDAPVAAVELDEALGGGLLWGQAGDEIGPLGGGTAFSVDGALDAGDLGEVGEVEVVVEEGGGPGGTQLDAPVALIGLLGRGGKPTSRSLPGPRARWVDCL